MADRDLTGSWLGRYAYADATGEDDDIVPFEARLAQDGTDLTGRATEPNTFRPDFGPELASTLDGRTAGDEIRFVKRYDGLPRNEAPHYRGRIDAKGERITGTWGFPSYPGFTGTFTMMRKPRAAARKGSRAGASIDA
ncbi:hypothetical protein MWU52_13960 [Jannaschia sp. S6380]|uniref:hypothetical protein n=1 Tax=Jannaschia sp. S6380 TaxID=2926408 RepID=UPI001FF37770|nr:hypothetical protein [Jannaschia sp. S6380]MCK0168660.1 hypothetical protein [Jannaschia sp. S6380]